MLFVTTRAGTATPLFHAAGKFCENLLEACGPGAIMHTADTGTFCFQKAPTERQDSSGYRFDRASLPLCFVRVLWRGAFNFRATVRKTVRPCYRTVVRLSVTLVYCGKTVGRIRMSLGMVVGLCPGHIVLDGDPAAP